MKPEEDINIVKARVKDQIRKAVQKYDGDDPKAAMLSGMSLVASYLAKLEGSRTITAALVLSSVCDIANEMNLETGKL